MPKMELTHKMINAAVCPQDKRYIYIMDTVVPGLGLQVTSSGTKSYIIRYQYNGKRYSKAFAAVDKLSLSAARTRAREIMAEYIMGKDPFAAQKNDRKNKLTMQQLYDAWGKEHIKRGETRPGPQCMWYGIKKYFNTNKKYAESLTSRDLEYFKSAATKAGTKPSTINRYLTALKQLYTWGMSQGLVSDYDFPRCTRMSEAMISPKTHHLSQEDIQKLIEEAMRTSSQKEYLRWIILFMLNTGIRPASICGLEWKDVLRLDTNGGEIRLRAANIKTRKDVNLPISAAAAEILQTLAVREHKPTDRIFTNYKSTTVNDNIKELMKKAGLPPELSAYSLRHNYATSLYMAGASPTEIQIQMCHSNYKTTQKYIHPNFEHQRDVANLLRFGSQADLKTQSA